MPRKVRIFVVCVFALLPKFGVHLVAQTKELPRPPGTLVGDVKDNAPTDYSGPIAYAAIFLRASGTKTEIRLEVNEKGQFRAMLPPGLYDIYVGADGFAPTCKVLVIESNKTTKYSPRLGPDVEHMDGVV